MMMTIIAAKPYKPSHKELMTLIKQLRHACDYNCKNFPHKTAENYAYWDIQDKIDAFFGREEKL